MEMHQVRYFLAVSRTQNFTRAAEECNVTQPSLTRAIKQLEYELGGDLFFRERPASQLTELGQRMRPFLQAHSGGVECVGVDESGVVTLRLEAHGCASASGTLKTAIEDRLAEAAPDITRLIVESAAAPSGSVAFVPVGDLLRNRVPAARSAG